MYEFRVRFHLGVLKVRMNNIPALVQIMAWRRPGDKPLSGPMMVSLLTYICVIRPEWIIAHYSWISSRTTPLWLATATNTMSSWRQREYADKLSLNDAELIRGMCKMYNWMVVFDDCKWKPDNKSNPWYGRHGSCLYLMPNRHQDTPLIEHVALAAITGTCITGVKALATLMHASELWRLTLLCIWSQEASLKSVQVAMVTVGKEFLQYS